MDQVSIVIPTFNRFKYLMNTIKSVKQQTYGNLEIIIVNDCSAEQEYYDYDWEGNGLTIVHLKENSRVKSKRLFGTAGCGYVRNKGIEKCNGKYIAFCDDDDIWFPEKIKLQLDAMKRTGCKMSSTDGLFGYGSYNENLKYKKYNAEYYFQTLYKIYEKYSANIGRKTLQKIPLINKVVNQKTNNMLANGFPDIWTFEFLNVHNCIIMSSVVLEKSILTKINNFKNIRNGKEDYDCWLRALKHTNSAYVKEICFYYDGGHGDGQEW